MDGLTPRALDIPSGAERPVRGAARARVLPGDLLRSCPMFGGALRARPFRVFSSSPLAARSTPAGARMQGILPVLPDLRGYIRSSCTAISGSRPS